MKIFLFKEEKEEEREGEGLGAITHILNLSIPPFAQVIPPPPFQLQQTTEKSMMSISIRGEKQGVSKSPHWLPYSEPENQEKIKKKSIEH